MKSDLAYLKHISDAISKIEKYVKDMVLEEFSKDSKTQDAVVRELEIIGEATKKLTKETRQQYPEVPWTEVAGTRDRLIHAYFDVDVVEVWKTVKRDLPLLKSTVKKAITKAKKRSEKTKIHASPQQNLISRY